jgi:hypothetical protein
MNQQEEIRETHYFDMARQAEIEYFLPEGKYQMFILQLDQFIAPAKCSDLAIAVIVSGIDGKVNSKGEKSNILAIIPRDKDGVYRYDPIVPAHTSLHHKASSVTLGFATLKGDPVFPETDNPFIVSFTLSYIPA